MHRTGRVNRLKLVSYSLLLMSLVLIESLKENLNLREVKVIAKYSGCQNYSKFRETEPIDLILGNPL